MPHRDSSARRPHRGHRSPRGRRSAHAVDAVFGASALGCAGLGLARASRVEGVTRSLREPAPQPGEVFAHHAGRRYRGGGRALDRHVGAVRQASHSAELRVARSEHADFPRLSELAGARRQQGRRALHGFRLGARLGAPAASLHGARASFSLLRELGRLGRARRFDRERGCPPDRREPGLRRHHRPEGRPGTPALEPRHGKRQRRLRVGRDARGKTLSRRSRRR